MNDHTEYYIDPEGEHRCATCDKWLEPGTYDIDDHHRSETRKASPHPMSCCDGGPQWGHAWNCPKCPD